MQDSESATCCLFFVKRSLTLTMNKISRMVVKKSKLDRFLTEYARANLLSK